MNRNLPRTPPTRGATTAELLMHLQHEGNPVTKSSYRQIIGNRIDRALGLQTEER